MKQRLAMLLLLFLGGVFVQTAAAAALSPAQAREALGQMYTSRRSVTAAGEEAEEREAIILKCRDVPACSRKKKKCSTPLD